MSSDSDFENKLLHGYEKHISTFEKWCEYAANALGQIRQCGIIELDSVGDALIVANRPDIGEQNATKKWYDHEPIWSFFKNPEENISIFTTHFGWEDSNVYVGGYKGSMLYHRDILSDGTQQICFFTSDHPSVYQKLIQNLSLAKKLIKFFRKENEKILEYQRERKFNLSSRSTNYFVVNETDKTERDKMNDLLHAIGMLESDVFITEREWQCLKQLEFGRTSREASQALGISKKTVEWHLACLKRKLKVHSRSQLLETIK